MQKTAPSIAITTAPSDFAPTQTQIEALARRLMPEIKKFFADEQVQRGFEEWKKGQTS